MYYLGIDPGVGGGYALIDETGKLVIFKKFESWREVRNNLRDFKRQFNSCAIEKVSSMSGQGVKSTFTFGANYGGWLAFLEMSGISHALVPPQRWQKMFLGAFPKGQSKVRSLDFINRRYPNAKLKKTHHGISDAICLALYSLTLDRSVRLKRVSEDAETKF